MSDTFSEDFEWLRFRGFADSVEFLLLGFDPFYRVCLGRQEYKKKLIPQREKFKN
jgi:hypothetical protein